MRKKKTQMIEAIFIILPFAVGIALAYIGKGNTDNKYTNEK